MALGLIANMIVPTYSGSVDFQAFGGWCNAVPRVAWNTIGVIVYTVCAIAGRESLAAIFTNFLALMGYWVAIWVAIFLEEHLIFRRPVHGIGWDWEAWNDRAKLPLGAAALTAFLVGWVGSILFMFVLSLVPFCAQLVFLGCFRLPLRFQVWLIRTTAPVADLRQHLNKAASR